MHGRADVRAGEPLCAGMRAGRSGWVHGGGARWEYAPVSDAVRPDQLRVSDAERTTVQERLRRAVADGQLDLHEFDIRLQSVWAAKTRGELARVSADLPEPPPPPEPWAVFAADDAGTAMRVLTIIWACAVAVNLVVWATVSLATSQFLHPWWLYVAGPPGAVLAVLYAFGIGRPER